jgi:K+-sensing histidine kinase KdpD
MQISLPIRLLRLGVVLNYTIAVFVIAAALITGLMFEHFLQSSPHVSLFLCAILFIAWACGTGPAIFATVLTILAFDYFILEPTARGVCGRGLLCRRTEYGTKKVGCLASVRP